MGSRGSNPLLRTKIDFLIVTCYILKPMNIYKFSGLPISTEETEGRLTPE